MIGDDDCVEIGGMKIGRVLGEDLPQSHFVHHKIPRDQTRVWTRAAAVGSLRLTAWAMARPTARLTRCYRQLQADLFHFESAEVF
jgi:hypothetical protein